MPLSLFNMSIVWTRAPLWSNNMRYYFWEAESWLISAIHKPNFLSPTPTKATCKRSTLIFLLKFRCARFCWNLCSSCLRSSRVNLPTLLVSPYMGDKFPPPTVITVVDLCMEAHHPMALWIRKVHIFLSSRGGASEWCLCYFPFHISWFYDSTGKQYLSSENFINSKREEITWRSPALWARRIDGAAM